MAKEFTAAFQPAAIEKHDYLKIPAQQIDYQRGMSEIMQLNPSISEVKQIFKIALNETGARVYAETSMRTGLLTRLATAPKVAVFGSKGPIILAY